MAETVATSTVSTTTQIHVSGITIACPLDGDMSATVNFRKAKIDDSGNVLGYEVINPDTEGHTTISLDQAKIVELLTEATLNQVKSDLHDLRKADLNQ
jgi:hypothetical protein